jgi:hypothetical protein
LSTETLSLRDFAAPRFEPLVGQPVRFLRPESQPVDLELVSTRAQQAPSAPGLRPPFSLLFKVCQAAPLNDRLLHTLDQPGFERCELLLSRVTVPELDRRDGTLYYEAVFG